MLFIPHFSIPTISEDAARAALLELASSKCCYGKAAARELIFTNITQSSAFHVSGPSKSCDYNINIM